MPGRRITTFARLVRRGGVARGGDVGPLRLGVDLGTANLVCAVVDNKNRPVAGAWRAGRVVRDGVVVDWHGAVATINELKQGIEDRLGVHFERAAVAIPPGIDAGTIKVFTNVLQACGLACDEIVDEPVAAASALGVTDGAIIDVGGGTTGVSLLRDGRTELSVDEATGGHHMNLVISGALGIDYDAAERFKVDRPTPTRCSGSCGRRSRRWP